jgi:DNA-binding transcriptional ArsR family regulator
MQNKNWKLLESLKENMATSGELPPQAIAAISERLEKAILCDGQEQIDEVSAQLLDFFRHLLKISSPAVIDAVKGIVTSNSDASTAFLLGQVSFAQLLSSQVADHIASRVTKDMPLLRRQKKILLALLQGNKTCGELAQIAQIDVATVSRKLKELRTLGITEFRREGTNSVNFLTPTGRMLVIEARLNLLEVVTPIRQPLPPLIKAKAEQLPEYMQHPATFAPNMQLRSVA